jgi:hypothetical protein
MQNQIKNGPEIVRHIEIPNKQEPIVGVNNVTHKIAEFFSNWNGDEDAKMEISVNDMREIADVYIRKARIERQLKEKALEQESCEDCISREAVLAMSDYIGEAPTYSNPYAKLEEVVRVEDINALPSIQPKSEIKPIGYRECSDAMLKMWMDNVLTDGEYYRIMDKLNAKWSKMNEVTK